MYISISEHVIQIRKKLYPFYTIDKYLRRKKSGILLAILQNNQLEVIFYFFLNRFIGNQVGSLKSSFVLQGKRVFHTKSLKSTFAV